jgi:hypothetical protein
MIFKLVDYINSAARFAEEIGFRPKLPVPFAKRRRKGLPQLRGNPFL